MVLASARLTGKVQHVNCIHALAVAVNRANVTRARVFAPVTRGTRDLGAIKRQVCVHMTALDMASACTKEAVKLWAVGFADVTLSGWVLDAKIIDAPWTVP